MAEPSSDARFLFTSESSMTPAPDTPQATPPRQSRPSRGFFIAPPPLPPAEKKQYKELPESTLTSEVDVGPLDEVIGEYHEKGSLYYFARYQNGIAHKFPGKPFMATHSSLVEEYERKKAEGKLLPFDPSAHYVHPKSRIRMVVNIANKRATVNISARYRQHETGNETDEVPDSEEEADKSDNDDYSEEGSSIQVRRSTRATGKSVKILPFSPKKTRSQKMFVLPDSDEDDDQSEVIERPTRRSTRVRKSLRVGLGVDTSSYGSEDEDEESDSYTSSNISKPRGKKPKKIIRGKASRPAYGHFRVVADLDYDSHSDEESAPLREHRKICEKCHRGPAHELLEAAEKKPMGRGNKKKKEDEFEESGDEKQKLTGLGGWVRCLKCPVSAHWRCLAATQRDEILKAARDRDRAIWRSTQPQSDLLDDDGRPKTSKDEPGRRAGLDAYQTTEFICGACMKGGVCMGCMETAIEPDPSLLPKTTEASSVSSNEVQATAGQAKSGDVEMLDGTRGASSAPLLKDEASGHNSAYELLFRCFTCKRLSHYGHLPQPPDIASDASVGDIAHYYQTDGEWRCADCSSYRYNLDWILAWRPYPPHAVEPSRPADEPPHYKSPLPREYLVKWADRSYRRTEWVPHMWLVSMNPAKLKNFLAGGAKVELLTEAVDNAKMSDMDVEEDAPPLTFEIINDESRASSAKPGAKTPTLPSDATPDADRKIPPAWKTVDRVLDVLLWNPQQRLVSRKKKGNIKKGKGKPMRVDSDEDMDEDAGIQEELRAAFEEGEQPSEDLTETVEDWEARARQKFSMQKIELVVWAFIKWDDLGYDEATWDSPPRPEESGYSAFEMALKRFIESRNVVIPKRSKSDLQSFDRRAKDGYRRKYALEDASELDLGQNPQLKLMPFQVDGFNWLSNNWWNHQHCILADEMGLGKTVQIATFIGNLVAKFKAYPALIVVPNSTITNWTREFGRWAPNLRVVPFYGEAKARDVIKKFELWHDKHRSDETGSKFHVLITTYECVLNPKDFTPVFRKQPRWEVLVIDEGQRLKSDTSLLFKKLNELNSIHRVIMTGTPLNNNMRELFNLMNFLDPEEWHDLEDLEQEHKELTEDLVKQLHSRLRPYFLRRIKSEVLQLPPKNEVIVPVSMAPLQKEVYRSILSHNLDILNGLTQPSKKLTGPPKSRLNNVLMHLRKCLQHPYLYAEDIEPRGLPAQETHEKLIDGSAKLRFLKTLLPKLKARGHRVLLFSQFVIALDVIEDFLNGEGHKYLRLDGNTKGGDRQKGMDEFNRPGSDVFIYLLTTRAGGVGINLFSADTVIIFDPDFNPHQDLQAIARAHRFGQQKTCLVFKLMVKDSAEERIVQVGKKKLVLDHLIVQKMDDEDSAGENVQSILTYGAKALFDSEEDARDIVYTENDIEKLIEKTEKEGDQPEATKAEGLSFSFAKIWAADKDSLEEVEDDDQTDSWAQTLQKITAEREKVQIKEVAVSGRGARRAAAMLKQNPYVDNSPIKSTSNTKGKSKSRSSTSDSSAYAVSDISSDDDESDNPTNLTAQDLSLTTANPEPTPHRKSTLIPSISPSTTVAGQSGPTPGARYRPSVASNGPLAAIQNLGEHDAPDFCGLCTKRHGDRDGDCPMTEKSENLVEFREMLLLHAGDEPLEHRRAAIKAIDETLQKRGQSHMIVGQPLFLVEKLPVPVSAPSRKVSRSEEVSKSAAPPQTFHTKTAKKVTTRPSLPSSLHTVPGPSMQAIPPALVQEPAKNLVDNSTAQTQRLVMTKPEERAKAALPMGKASVTGSSKRALSPLPAEETSRKKKAKEPAPSCPVCGLSPHHLVKDCPIVAQGPNSVAKEIKRLDTDPSMASTVAVLRKLLRKQKKREVEHAHARSSSHPIEISD